MASTTCKGSMEAQAAAFRAMAMDEMRDRVWLRSSRIGVSQLRSGSAPVASRLAERAADTARGFPAGDPRTAASLNNAAMAHCAAGAISEAERFYAAAIQAWARAIHEWVERMRLGQRARSSSFHLRMEQKYRARYDEAARLEHRRELHAGRLLSALNLADLRGQTAAPRAARRQYAEIRAEAHDTLPEQHPFRVFVRERDAWPVRSAGVPAAWGLVAGLKSPRPPVLSDEPRVVWALCWTLTSAPSNGSPGIPAGAFHE